MAPRIVGIDSWSQSTEAILQTAARLMGQGPSFHGRYFHGPSNSAPEFNDVTDEPALARHQVRVAPVLRQTNRVGLGLSEGRADGAMNARDIIAAFDEDYLRESCGNVRAFLDVEGDKYSRLSRDYYLGLCEGLDSVSDIFWPCVYGLPGDAHTWAELAAALDAGAACYGAWLSAPYVSSYVASHEPIQWTPGMMKYYPLSSRVPILCWQYGFPDKHAPANEQFDRNLVNPAEADGFAFLRTLPLPRIKE